MCQQCALRLVTAYELDSLARRDCFLPIVALGALEESFLAVVLRFPRYPA